MISFLKGTLAGKSLDAAFVEVNGVGFAVGMSQASLTKLPEAGEKVQIYTYLQVREDNMQLFGFLTLEEKAVFEELIGVSGVGAKIALAALTCFNSPQALAAAISAQDVAAVQKIPGVGKKMASRIILELKGSFDEGLQGLFASSSEGGGVVSKDLQGAREALLSMGFTSAEADLALNGAPEGASESKLLQFALKKLGS